MFGVGVAASNRPSDGNQVAPPDHKLWFWNHSLLRFGSPSSLNPLLVFLMCTSFACERYRKRPDEKHSESTLQTGCPLNHSAPDFNRQFVTIKRLCIVTWRWRFGGLKIGQSDANSMNDDDRRFDFWTRSPRPCNLRFPIQFLLFSVPFGKRRPVCLDNTTFQLDFVISARMYLCAQLFCFFHSFRSLNISSILSVLTSCAKKKHKIEFVAVEAWHGWRSGGTTSETSHDFEL